MIVRLKAGLLIVTAENEAEKAASTAWIKGVEGHVFVVTNQDSQTFRLNDLGPRLEACREPINVMSRAADPAVQLISNFAHTPFQLDGRQYASVEAFWQGLKFPDEARRLAIAPLHGQDARKAGFDAVDAEKIQYEGQTIRVGTIDHWRLMTHACRAKFEQHIESRNALIATGERPLMHKTRRDSVNIPGVIMADIWMKIRRGLLKKQEEEEED